jgi:hypothetical protein
MFRALENLPRESNASKILYGYEQLYFSPPPHGMQLEGHVHA